MNFWVDNEGKFKGLINILRDSMEKDEKLELHSHEFCEMEYVLYGSGIQTINGKEYSVKRGDFIFLKESDSHTYRTDDHLEILNVIFFYSVFEELTNILYMYTTDFEIPTIMHIGGEDMLRIEELLLNAEKEFLSGRTGYYQILKSFLTILWISLWRITSKSQSKARQRFTDVIEFIDKDPFNLSIHTVASYYGYTNDYFSSMFKKTFGISFTEYINKKRVNRAIELLITTNMSVESICGAVGLNDKKNFYNMFKRYVGITPGAFRKQNLE